MIKKKLKDVEEEITEIADEIQIEDKMLNFIDEYFSSLMDKEKTLAKDLTAQKEYLLKLIEDKKRISSHSKEKSEKVIQKAREARKKFMRKDAEVIHDIKLFEKQFKRIRDIRHLLIKIEFENHIIQKELEKLILKGKMLHSHLNVHEYNELLEELKKQYNDIQKEQKQYRQDLDKLNKNLYQIL